VLTAANERPYVRALQEVALTRARLFEWIALLRKDTGATAPALFATGAFSLLGPILDLPQPRVLTQVSLPEAGRATLLEEEGPWRSYLDLAAALESAEVHAIESAARALGLDVRRALELHGAAAEWAADVTAEMSDLPAVARRRARA
jgi:c-di-GMP-related signal transduction protein